MPDKDVRPPRGLSARTTLTAALAALWLLAMPATGLAQGGSSAGTYSISPARREVVARPPVSLVPTRVSNSTQVPYAVKVFPVLLSQDLSGAFNFSPNPRDLQEASTILSPSTTDFTLAPGTAEEVRLRWNLLPLNARAAYIGIVFQGTPRPNGKGVSVISRLLSINFLRLPGVYRSNGVFTGLPITQFAPQVLRLLPRVKNTGDVVDTPRHGRLVIKDATGRAVYKTHWAGDVIIPGAEREFAINVKQLLPAGAYTATAAMSFGANHNAKISRHFTLVGPNELPTPNVTITGFTANGTIGDPVHVTGRVTSTGTAPVSLDIDVALYRVLNGVAPDTPITTKRIHVGPLAPKGTANLDASIGKLIAGQYRVIGRYTDPTGAPQQLTSDFAPTRHRSFWDRFKSFLSDHALLLGSLLALAILIALLLSLWRRQRRLQHELEAARSGGAAPPPPPPPA